MTFLANALRRMLGRPSIPAGSAATTATAAPAGEGGEDGGFHFGRRGRKQDYRVDMDRVQKELTAGGIGRLDWLAREIVRSLKTGGHRSRNKGFSTEFSDFKPYTEGDDIRMLDWRLYARTEKFYVRKYEAETNLECLFLVDASRSMAWRWGKSLSKLEYAIVLTAALTLLMSKKQDRVGLLAFDGDDLKVIPPGSRRTQLGAMFAALENVKPAGGAILPRLLEHAPLVKPHRGRIVLCSDMEEEPDQVMPLFTELAGKGDEVILVHLLDKAEVELPYSDRVSLLADSENGRRWVVDMPHLKKRHRERIHGFRKEWVDLCHDNVIRYVPLDTSTPFTDAVRDIVEV